MGSGVFGAAGYRASLSSDDDSDNNLDNSEGDLDNDFESDSTNNDTDSSASRDSMIRESSIVYGAEPIYREMELAHSPVRVGKVGNSDLYITPELTFDLDPAQPHVSPEQRHQLAKNEPAEIRHLLGMFHFTAPRERAQEFIKEARYMENYELQGSFDASFHAFYPVYSDMTVRQLKGYFAWRTRVRRGEYPLTSSSAAFIYIYELINGIGVKNGVDAYAKLRDFRHYYADRYDANMERYLGWWMRDLVIAENLQGDPLAEQFGTKITADRSYAVLAHPDKATDLQIADALGTLGSYKSARSPLMKLSASLYDCILTTAWKAVVSSHVTAKSYFHSRVATWKMTPVTLFQRAVYYDRDLADHPYETRRVHIDAAREYTRENGHWYCGSFEPVTGQRSYMNDFLHEVDRIGRHVWQTGRDLKPRGFYPSYTQVIEKALVGLKHTVDREQWEVAHPPVHVDLSQLTAIRTAAAWTRESLLTQEERDAEAEEAQREAAEAQKEATKARERASQAQKNASAVENETQQQACQQSPSPQFESSQSELSPSESFQTELSQPQSDQPPAQTLTDDELYLLRALVNHTPAARWKAHLLARHLLPSVLADSINDKLFDFVGDSVVETDDNGDLSLVFDYEADVNDFLAS